jgi:hypothetical protein
VLKKGFWTEGNIANIFVECPEYDQAKSIVFNLNNSVAPSNETLNLEIILNEVKIGKFKITDNFSGELKVELDQSKLSSGVNKLQFNISNPSSLIEKRKKQTANGKDLKFNHILPYTVLSFQYFLYSIPFLYICTQNYPYGIN